ncbi:hypothetical protein niasHT_025118 [Heterodera trifolii]|uniref:Uncharacterized protein n=1 Tax=Heterodera trifolii TaxID=157864 RepID=A0ABD2K1C2_9BILA
MADPIDSKYFGFVPATEEQQGTSADVFGLGQFVPSAAVVSSSSSIGAVLVIISSSKDSSNSRTRRWWANL